MPTLEMQICALQIFCDLALLPLLPYVQKSVFAPLLNAKELGNTPLRRYPLPPLCTPSHLRQSAVCSAFSLRAIQVQNIGNTLGSKHR
jgi:hypothetical protein